MNRQEALDKAYLGLMDQGLPSVDEYGECSYRTSGGLKCIIGFLVDDDTATAWDSENDPSICCVQIPDKYEWISTDMEFFNNMQELHDFLRLIEDQKYFRFTLTVISNIFAKKYELTLPTWEGNK